MIEVQNVTKKYGTVNVLNDISFCVNKGEVLGFLGRNGAGKSTMLNIITGCISCDQGSVRINGHDILTEPNEAKKAIGYLPEQPPLYFDLKVGEFLKFVCQLKGVEKSKRLQSIEYAMETTNTTQASGMLIRNLSKGFRQRVGFAAALCGSPEILILDEPTAGLDPKQIYDFRGTIKKLKGKHTILFSSHILGDVEDVSDRVVIINNGRIIHEGTRNALLNTPGRFCNIVLQIPEIDSDRIAETIREMEGLISARRVEGTEEGVASFSLECACDLRSSIAEFVIASKSRILGLSLLVPSTLEDLFLKTTQN